MVTDLSAFGVNSNSAAVDGRGRIYLLPEQRRPRAGKERLTDTLSKTIQNPDNDRQLTMLRLLLP